MNDIRTMACDTADRIFRDHVDKARVDLAEEGHWPTQLWEALTGAGLITAAVPEAAGGGGMALADAMAVLSRAGSHAAPVPLAEAMLAAGAIAGAGVRLPEDGLLTLAYADDDLDVTGGQLRGWLHHVPWGRAAAHVLVVEPGGARGWLVATGGAAVTTGVNLGGEARDSLQLAGAGEPVALGAETGLLARLALARAVAMAGAMNAVLETTVAYALERSQFGKPIAGFQAIQQQLAAMAGEVAAATRAADAGLDALESAAAPSSEVALEQAVAVAKARTGEAVRAVTGIAHQVHAAMGFTHEHHLHQLTRRLWAWRDEYGDERFWQARLGRALAAGGADRAWSFVVGH